MKTKTCCNGWKTGGIVVGVFSLIGSFPISTSGDVSVSCEFPLECDFQKRIK